MSFLTIFTCPKPFTNPHINRIQRNAIRSWKELGTDVEVILLGEENGLAQAARELGVHHIADIQRNNYGTPLVSASFDAARQNSGSPYLAFVNTDILLLPDFVQAVRDVSSQSQGFLMVGQRWDLDVQESLEFEGNWVESLRHRCQSQGKLHSRGGSDYFIFPRNCFTQIPPLAVGRAGWDNWMIYWGRARGWKVIDSTSSIQIIHQSHDYSHLPGGKPHYHLPESDENVRIGGGRRTIFNLDDANFQLQDHTLYHFPNSWKKFTREVETFPLIRLHSTGLAQLSFALFHPKKAWGELRLWLVQKLRSGKS